MKQIPDCKKCCNCLTQSLLLWQHASIPHFKPKINTGSRIIILATAPARVDAIANFGFPSDLIIGFMAWANM